MTVPVYVLDADVASLGTIETAVNALRAALDPPVTAATSDEIKAGCIQVGLNALLDWEDVPNAVTTYPLLSIVGEPGATSNITTDADLTARVTAAATALSQSETDVRSLALHAGVLMMTGVTTLPYRPSFA